MDFSKIKRYGVFGIALLFILSLITLVYGVKNEMDRQNIKKSSIVHILRVSDLDINKDYNI